MIDENKIPISTGDHIYLRRLVPSDKSQRYLSWLNDPEVQKYSSRRGRTLSMEDMAHFLEFVHFSRDLHLAILTNDNHLHIGNIALNRIDGTNRSAALTTMMGDRSYWDKGLEIEAIRLLIDYAFNDLKLHRLYAASSSPSFNSIIKKLNWVQEGVDREAFLTNGVYEDYIRWSILESEWKNNYES